MKDYLAFYSIDANNKINLLFGQSNRNSTTYGFFDYTYENPIDDSPIVNTFNREFGNLIITPEELLNIIKKTVYPHFLKYYDDGLIYLIRIDPLNENNLNRLLDDYRISYSRSGHGRLRWLSLKWVNIDDLPNYIIDTFTKSLIDKHNIIPFLKNQYNVNKSQFSQTDFSMIEKLVHKKKTKSLEKSILQNKWKAFVNAQMAYFKETDYNKIIILYNYTDSTAKKINKILRRILKFGEKTYESALSKGLQNLLDYIDQALILIDLINNAPKYDQFGNNYLSLYRGLSFDPLLKFGDVTDIFKYNLNSTSLDFNMTANMFVPAQGSLFNLIIPPETPLLTVSNLSHYSYEDEVLLTPGLTFKVISVTEYYNKYLDMTQKFYVAILDNKVDLKQKLADAKDQIVKKLSTSKTISLKKHKPAKISLNFPTPANSKQIKQALLTLNKLVENIAKKDKKCLPNHLTDLTSHICYPLESTHAKAILNEQLQLLIDQKSPFQKSFDYDQEIAVFKHIFKSMKPIQIINKFIQKLISRLSEE